MVVNFPKTILMLAVNLSPVIMFLLRPEFMLQTLVVWFFLAPGLIAQGDSYILLPVFQKLENSGEEPVKEDVEETEDG